MSCAGALTPLFTRTTTPTQMFPSWGEHHRPTMRSSGSCSTALKPGTVTEINCLALQWTNKKKHQPNLERRNFHVHKFSRLRKRKKNFLIYVTSLCGCISQRKIFKTTLTFTRGQTLWIFFNIFFLNESAVPSPVWVRILRRESINTFRRWLWEPRTEDWFETIVLYTQAKWNP